LLDLVWASFLNKESQMSKFSILLLVAFTFIAAQNSYAKTLACRPLETKHSSKLFRDIKIALELPDLEKSMNDEWTAQSVQFSWTEEKEAGKFGPAKENVGMKPARLGATKALIGDFSLGGDFGTVNLSLFSDYDSDEVIAMLDIFSDGPNTKELYRCK
jgi:hypothetical protein